MTVKNLFMTMENTFVAIEMNGEIAWSGMSDNMKFFGYLPSREVINIKISNNSKSATIITVK